MSKIQYRNLDLTIKGIIDKTKSNRPIFKMSTNQYNNIRYWANELNSDKFRQCDSQLVLSDKNTITRTNVSTFHNSSINDRFNNSYCCLGVACVLKDKLRFGSDYEIKGGSLKRAITAQGNETNVIPKSVSSMFYISDRDHAINKDRSLGEALALLRADDTDELKANAHFLRSASLFSYFNDEGHSFGTIAYYIREFILRNAVVTE